MPFVMNADTEKEDTIKELHQKWKDLKTTHAVVIKGAGIDFNKGLGAYLDKRATLWKDVHAAKAKVNIAKPSTSDLANFRSKLVALKANAKSAGAIVAGYFVSVRKLNVANTKVMSNALERQLVSIDKALKYDESYADNMGPKKA